MAKKPSKKVLISEIKRVSKQFPEAEITRDFFRANSKLKDSWSAYWPNFTAFAVAAKVKTLTAPAKSTVQIPLSPALQLDLVKEKIKAKQSGFEEQLKHAAGRIIQLETERDAALSIGQKTPQITIIVPKVPSGSSESVAIFMASDWHVEENVALESVGGLNIFNLDIADARITKFFQGQFRMFDIMHRDTTIKTAILALLGDFITNTIHEDLAETNNLGPADAIYWVECRILSGIKFLLEQLPKDVELLVVCHAGNHGRMTKKQRGSSEAANSLEHYMYYHIRDMLKGEPRIKFQIAEGYHTFTHLFDDRFTIRWHHGHAIKYQGGVGGIYIPVLKAINQWNKAKWADLDAFGHFHQATNAGGFLANGSLIGYNDFSVRIKGDFEKPQQMFSLVNKKWNSKTMTTPIFLE